MDAPPHRRCLAAPAIAQRPVALDDLDLGIMDVCQHLTKVSHVSPNVGYIPCTELAAWARFLRL